MAYVHPLLSQNTSRPSKNPGADPTAMKHSSRCFFPASVSTSSKPHAPSSSPAACLPPTSAPSKAFYPGICQMTCTTNRMLGLMMGQRSQLRSFLQGLLVRSISTKVEYSDCKGSAQGYGQYVGDVA